MKKQLLSIALLSAVVSGAMAHEIGDKVYSNSAKWKITGKNLVTNGDFSDNKLTGWTAIDGSINKLTTFSVLEGQGAKGANEIKVNEGQTALTNGIYQTIAIQQGGTYIVSMKVMNNKAAGFTDFDLTGANTNYINAYYNTDGALATAGGDKNTTLSYGTDGVCGGYTFSFTTDKFTEVNFPVQAPADGQIVIDLRGLSEGLEICDVTCQAAEKIYDTRIPAKRIAYIESVLNSYNFKERTSYFDLADEINTIKGMIESNEEEGYETEMENLETYWKAFTEECFSNVLNSINTGASGNYSANWDNWTGKFNKLNSEASAYNAVSGWSWSTDRWCHKTAEANSPLQIQWMRGSSGPYDNIATNTTTLDKGTYFFGFQGAGGMMTLNTNRWTRSQAKECAETYVFFNNDTTDMFLLPTSNEMASTYGNVIYKFEVAEDNTPVKFGIRCNIGQGQVAKDGFDVNFYHPVLYKVLVKGELTPEEKTYLDNVQTQIDALKGRIKVAEDYVAETQKELPWGKEDLKAGIEEAKKRLAVWDAMSEDDRIATMDNYSAEYEATQAPYYVDGAYVMKDTTYQQVNDEKALQNLIMNAGVRYINNNFINVFEAKNAPLTDMPGAIERAQETRNARLYSACDASNLDAEITKAQAMYEEKLAKQYSAEDAEALVQEKAALAAAVDAFAASIAKDLIVDIDFSNTVVEGGEPEAPTYIVEGNKGSILLPNYSVEQNTNYTLGWSEANTDVLRVGKGDAVVEFTGVEPNSTDIIVIAYDIYYGSLINRNAGTTIYSGEEEIAGLNISKYSGTSVINTFDVDFNGKITSVGNSSVSNDKIVAESNKTHIEYILDYGDQSMYMTTSGSKGSYTWATTKDEALVATDGRVFLDPAKPVNKFVLTSNYDNADRRSWFDNLQIYKIAASASENPAVTGIQNVEAVNPTAAKAVKKLENGKIVIVKGGKKYTVAGAQIK